MQMRIKCLILALFAVLVSAFGVNAQDIIVKNDGTAIAAKVLKITPTEIEYKKYSNQEGPTYVLPVAVLMSVSYENGARELFNQEKQKGAASEVADAAVSVGIARDSQMSDMELLEKFRNSDYTKHMRRAKVFKIAAWTSFGVCAAATIVIASTTDMSWDANWIPAVGIGGLGVVCGATLMTMSYLEKRRAEKCFDIVSAPIIECELFNRGNERLTAGLEFMKENLSYSGSLGISARLTF